MSFQAALCFTMESPGEEKGQHPFERQNAKELYITTPESGLIRETPGFLDFSSKVGEKSLGPQILL